MRCKVGDIAVIVGGAYEMLLGKVVTCVELIHDFPSPHWVVDPEPIDPSDGRPFAIDDRTLRPLRDPGDDAQDEMLRPLPQEVTA
ncbi:MAG: hypothetical protein DI563_02015 [Variovorax paradoxus]|uniref:Uncharacterized protein n=1 Tax=Variovorax paradoxus TaxID=34073 RepID=A0A2W5S5C7_VARPD|nr:MAG: hypothetical protein DI563_02015 [Variovorax paradoxus]